MAKNKDNRPEWFRLWRRNRRQLDIGLLSMESRGIIFTNAMRYFDTGEIELLEMSELENMAFTILKCNIDDSFSEYAERAETNRDNGKKGGRPRRMANDDSRDNPVGYEKTQSVAKKQKNPKKEDGRKKTEERVQSTENKNEDDPLKASRFTPPTLDEVAAYCHDRGDQVDPQRFIDFYTANGWVQGKGKRIRDWKAAVRTLERNNRNSSVTDKVAQYSYNYEGDDTL